MSKNLKHRLVQSLVIPYLRYCDVVYSDMSTDLESRLQRDQNSCLRIIYGLKKFDQRESKWEIWKIIFIYSY